MKAALFLLLVNAANHPFGVIIKLNLNNLEQSVKTGFVDFITSLFFTCGVAKF